MITQQQALEALQSKTESAKRGHRDANGAFVTYDGAAADLNALARYVTTLESVLRQYIEQGAGADALRELAAAKRNLDFESNARNHGSAPEAMLAALAAKKRFDAALNAVLEQSK